MEMMGARSGRMSQTNPDLQAIPGHSAKAREEFAKTFCKFDFTGQVPQEKENNA